MENSNETFTQDFLENSKPKRSVSLSVILVFSALNAVLQFFSYLLFFVFYANFKELSTELPQSIAFMQDALEILLNANKFFFIVMAAIYALSFCGAFFMFNMKKIGFHIYACAQIGVIVCELLFVGKQMVSIGDVMLTILFVIYYATNLKNFK